MVLNMQSGKRPPPAPEPLPRPGLPEREGDRRFTGRGMTIAELEERMKRFRSEAPEAVAANGN